MAVRPVVPREAVAEFCRRWNVVELSLFGSILRDDFGPDSDVDVLVRFGPGSERSLADLIRMEDELREIFGRRVDLVDRRSVEGSENYIRRNHILRNLEQLYVA